MFKLEHMLYLSIRYQARNKQSENRGLSQQVLDLLRQSIFFTQLLGRVQLNIVLKVMDSLGSIQTRTAHPFLFLVC